MEGDTFAPQNAVGGLVKKSGNAPGKKHLHIRPGDAGVKSLNHLNWAKEPEFFAKTVQDWVKKL